MEEWHTFLWNLGTAFFLGVSVSRTFAHRFKAM
jgi:hypothetical protein